MSVSKISKNAFLVSLLELQVEGVTIDAAERCVDVVFGDPLKESDLDICRKMDVQPDGCIVGYNPFGGDRFCTEPCKPKSTFEKITVNDEFCRTKCRQVYVQSRDVCESIQHAEAVLGNPSAIGNAVGAVFACAECVPDSGSYGKCTFANGGDGVRELFVENKLVEEHCKQCFLQQDERLESRCIMGVDTLQKWHTEFTRIKSDYDEPIPAWILIAKPSNHVDYGDHEDRTFTEFKGSTGDKHEFCATMCHKP